VDGRIRPGFPKLYDLPVRDPTQGATGTMFEQNGPTSCKQGVTILLRIHLRYSLLRFIPSQEVKQKHAPVTSILAASGDISGWAQDIYSVTLRLAATDSPTLVSCPNASQLSQLPRCRKSQVRAVHLPDSCVLFLGHPGKCDRWQRVAFQQLASGSKNFGNSRPRLPTYRASDWKGGPCSVPAFGSRPNATDSSFSMACVSAASMLFANTSDAR
jgi:hypothetical protein